MNDDFEIKPVLLSQLIVAVVSDRRWYTITVIRRRIGLPMQDRGIIYGTVDRLRRLGFIRRAINPLYKGAPVWRHGPPKYVYQWTGLLWWNRAKGQPWQGTEYLAAQAHYIRFKHMSKPWRDLLK